MPIDGFASGSVFHVQDILAKILARRWWIASITVVITALFVAASYLMTPVYRASILLAPAKLDRSMGTLGSSLWQLGGLASLAGLAVGGGDTETDEAIAVLTSFAFTETFISERGLMQRLFADNWDDGAGKWKGEARKHPTPAKAFGYFDKKIRTVSQDRRTSLVTLEIDWKDRVEAAAWANGMVQRLNEEMRQRAIDEASASIGYLEGEFAKTTVVATRDAISRLLEAQVKRRMLVTVSKEYSFRVIDPAVVSDEDSPLRPKKLYMLLAGVLAGLVLGVLFVLSFDVFAGAVRSARALRRQ